MSAISCSIGLNTALTPEQREKYQNTDVIRDLMRESKTIAIVGLSSLTTKASNMVASYLMDEGYTVIPVNPRAAEILGQKSYPDLKSIPVPVDIVQVFRPTPEVPAIVDAAIEIGAKAVWTQLRIIDLDSADLAIAHGLVAIVDKCLKMEHGRWGGALHWAGMNTEIITARRAKMRSVSN